MAGQTVLAPVRRHKSWLTIADHTSVEPLITGRDPRYFMGVRVSHSGTLNSEQTVTSDHTTMLKRRQPLLLSGPHRYCHDTSQ